ncbi:MAG: hypothetical protein MHM6MM_006199 [Cercozoa sp. M6MM]
MFVVVGAMALFVSLFSVLLQEPQFYTSPHLRAQMALQQSARTVGSISNERHSGDNDNVSGSNDNTERTVRLDETHTTSVSEEKDQEGEQVALNVMATPEALASLARTYALDNNNLSRNAPDNDNSIGGDVTDNGRRTNDAACIDILQTGVSAAVDSSSESDNRGMRQQLQLTWQVLRQPHIAYPVAFIFLFTSRPNSGSALWFYLSTSEETGGLGFSTKFLAVMAIVSGFAHLIGSVVYRLFFANKTNDESESSSSGQLFLGLRGFLAALILCSCFLGFTPLVLVYRWYEHWHLSKQLFALGDEALVEALSTIMLLPVGIVVAKLCPRGVEGALFAAIGAIVTIGALLSRLFGAALTALFGVDIGVK